MKRLIRLFTPARLAAACTAVVFVAAFAISWESLRVLALAAGIRPLLAPLFPLTVDAVMVTGTVAAVALRSARWRIRAYTWLMVTAGIGVSVLGNAVHSSAHDEVLSLPLWAAAAASAVPALSLAASLHLFVLVLRDGRQDGRNSAHEEAPESEPVVVTEMPVLAAQQGPPNGQGTVRKSGAARGANRRRAARLIRTRPDVSASEAAKRLGVSRSTASRLLSEVRKSHAVVEQEPVTN